MNGITADAVKFAARGRWSDILVAVGGFNPERLDGAHHGCDMCKQGKDCFRTFKDFPETGGVYCNKCHSSNNGDGLAAIQRMTGWPFAEVLSAVAKFLNMHPVPNGHHRNGTVESETDGEESNDIASDRHDAITSGEDLEKFQELARSFRLKFAPFGETDNPTAKRLKEKGFQRCAENKPPIRAEDIVRLGALYGSYLPGTPFSLECIAVPGYLRPDDPGPTGWILRRVDGTMFSAYGSTSASKTRLITGSKDSWTIVDGWEGFEAAKEIWCFEGWPDLAAAVPHLPTGVAGVSNLCGAKSVPKDLRCFAGKRVVRFADSDADGIEGAEKFAAKVNRVADSVKVVVVPYEVTEDHGKDVRDFLAEGRSFAELMTLVEQTSEFVKPKKKTKTEANRERMAEVRKTRPAVDPFLDVFEAKGRTDTANARRLMRVYRSDVLYCHEWKKWLIWDQTHWQVDKSGAMQRYGKAIADAVWAEVGWNPGDDEAVKFGIKTSSIGGITAMLRLAESEVPISVGDLDTNPWLLNCPNGTVDLRTGELKRHRREDTITKVCRTNYNPNAKSDVFDRFLNSTFADRELIAFVQRLFGYCLTGSVKEQVMAVFHGIGSNGKSTLLNLIQFVIGSDFVNTAPASLLMEKRQETHPTELADLFGRRLVIAAETNQGAKLAESTVKALTGGDVISARRMREDFWTYSPTHKLVLLTNHKPRITGTDHAIWRRLVLVPFNSKFWNPAKGEIGPPEMKQDKDLPAKLEAEAEGVLAWMVRGCLEWQKLGLKIPDVVRAATAEYRSESDTIGRFIDECCLRNDREKFSKLYARLESWCTDNGENLPKKKAVGTYLKDNGYTEQHSNGCWYSGITLKEVIDSQEVDARCASDFDRV